MKKNEFEKPESGVAEQRVLTELFDHWSSHPQSLKKQRKWWFGIGLVPVAIVLAFLALLLTGASGWRMVLGHPTMLFWIVGGAVSLSLGLVFSFALLYLIARARISTRTEDPDRLPFPKALVVLFTFFWIVPATLSFVQSRWGVLLVPQQMLFLLNALCFAPFVLLLVWVRFAGGENVAEERKKARRPLWFALGTLFLGLAGISLVGDLQGWVRSLKLPASMTGLSTLALRAAALATLLPLSMVCYAIWLLFRRSMTDKEKDLEKAEEKTEKTERKSLWRRFLDFLRGRSEKPKDEEAEPEKNDPPSWLSKLCSSLPEGIQIKTKNPPLPDQLPSPDTPVSPISTSADADPFWMLMGGAEDRRPTELQVHFFNRFRNSLEECRLAAEKGNEVTPDIILSGDEGTGRTEALLAAAMYAAFARRQRVLYLVADSGQVETLCAKANRRFKDAFLECFLRCGVLTGKKARNWVAALKARAEERPSGQDSAGTGDDIVPPNILFATPRDVERLFFEGRGLDADGSSVGPLRELLRLFEVILVDDFMELDVAERAHLPFLLHKMRMILVSGNLRPQFVVVTPRLREDEGAKVVADRLFGAGFNLSGNGNGNAITLLPRACEPAWSVPLVLKDGLDVGAVCETIVRQCLNLSEDGGNGATDGDKKRLRIVLYRKGLHPHQCGELAARLAPADRREDLQVVSRIDEIDSDQGADAVFYLTSLAGRADMALRLSVGDGKTVYLSLSSESEAILGEDGGPKILPAIPDSTAVALRIHHLRSLLRFVVPGQPVDVSAWERFGVFLSRRMRVAEVEKGAVVHEKWRQDDWNEPAYGQPPLWPYVVFEGEGSVKSNAGKGTDFGVLPFTDEDVAQLGDSPLMGLIRPKGLRDGKVESVGVGAGSLAKWMDDQDVDRGAIDLAHAETLVLGRSALGDAYATASGAADTIFTVGAFEDVADDDRSCVCKLRMTSWNGNGMDFDTPIRTLSWTIEPVSVPRAPGTDAGRAFTFFDLPDCRGLPRMVGAQISGLANRIGQTQPAMPPRDYSYPAYFLGLLLAPRRLSPRDGLAQIQRGVVGPWKTEEESFSVVLTHLLTGVLLRIVPDLPFYALVPVFHQRGRENAVSAAVAWIVQPLNSGKTIESLVRSLFLQPSGQKALQGAIREARDIFLSRGDAPSRLRWLRSFSRSAFEFDLTAEGKTEAFEKDAEWSLEVLSVIDERISGNLSEIEEFSAPVPDIVRDHSWMSEARTFDGDGLQPESVWTERTELPESPALGRSGVVCRWHYAGKEFSIEVGFSEKDGSERYNGFLDGSFRERIDGDCYTEYGFNDPYREFMGKLCDELRKKLDDAFPGSTATQTAEYLLSFVQEGLPYVKDPKNKVSDWPRHPSETLMRFGGDCEDSSILYAELLRRFHIEGAILSVPEHAAVGVNVPLALTSDRTEPVVYTWLGKSYIYAETACSLDLCPLGSETELIRSADDMPADVIPTPDLVEDESTPVRILNAVGPNSGTLEITIVAPAGATGPLSVAVFARPRKEVFAAPDPKSYPCVGGAKLPVLAPRKVLSATIKLDTPSFQSYWCDVFVCETDTGTVRGHFVGVSRFSDRKRDGVE